MTTVEIFVPDGFVEGQEYPGFPGNTRQLFVSSNDRPFLVKSIGKSYSSDPGIKGRHWDIVENLPEIRWGDWVSHENEYAISWETVSIDPAQVQEWDLSHHLKEKNGHRNVCLPILQYQNKKVVHGISGRGRLGCFGPNGAVDPIVTRWKYDKHDNIVNDDEDNPILQVIMIKRGDNGALALPGGMNSHYETSDRVSIEETAARELLEETGGYPENDSKKTPDQLTYLNLVKKMFKNNGTIVYQGYVPDPRNTDHAWMVTTGINLHDDQPASMSGFFDRPLKSGFDTQEAFKIDVSTELLRELDIYANHKTLIELAYQYQVSRLTK